MSKKETTYRKTKNVSLTPTLTTLLEPSAEYLGNELASGLKATIEPLKQKLKEKRLRKHIENVSTFIQQKPSSSNSPNLTIYQLDIFEDWLEGISNVDEDSKVDEELRNLWYNLLADATKGNKHSQEVIAALKSLTPKEAHFLNSSNFQDTYIEEAKFIGQSLEKKGLTEKNYRYLLFLTTPCLLLLAYIISMPYEFFTDTIFRIFGKYSYPYSSFFGLKFLVGLMISMVIYSYIQKSLKYSYKLTWLGKELKKLSSSYNNT